MKFEELPEVEFLPGGIVVGDLAHEDVCAELLDLVANDLVDGGARGEGVPGVVAGVADGSRGSASLATISLSVYLQGWMKDSKVSRTMRKLVS